MWHSYEVLSNHNLFLWIFFVPFLPMIFVLSDFGYCGRIVGLLLDSALTHYRTLFSKKIILSKYTLNYDNIFFITTLFSCTFFVEIIILGSHVYELAIVIIMIL